MLQLILKTHLGFLLIPLLTLAIEPNNPTTYCDRFVGDDDKARCVQKASHKDLDWYASSACSLQEDDHSFLSCLDAIKGATFNPEALDLCANPTDLSDSARLSCLQKIKNKDYNRAQIKKCSGAGSQTAIEGCLSNNSRSPASLKGTPQGFQTLEVRK